MSVLDALQLPASQRAQPSFREQRKQKIEEYLSRRKTFSGLNRQEKQIKVSNNNWKEKASENKNQMATKALKLKTKMEDKENTNRTKLDKNSQTMERNGAPLKATTVLTNSSAALSSKNIGDSSQIVQVSLTEENNAKVQRMSFSQAFLIKRNRKEEQLIAEKLKSDVNLPKKPVLGSYRGKVVQSKINSFRKPPPRKDEHSLTRATPSAIVSKPAVRPPSASGGAVKGGRISNEAISTKSGSIGSSQIRSLVRPPLRNHPDPIPKQTIHRASVQVTASKEPHTKRPLLSNPVPSTVKKGPPASQVKPTLSNVKKRPPPGKPALANAKTDASDGLGKKEAVPVTSRAPAQPAPSTLQAKSMGIRRSTLSKESAEERRARLAEWKASKGKVLKRPPISMPPAQSEPKEQQVESFWTTIVEEEEQVLFTEKVNSSFAECLKLINEGCPREEVLDILDKVIQNIPDARKLVKYWVCLARLEPITNPIEDLISIYEKALLAGAKPIEELRHTVTDILKKKNLAQTDVGESVNAINTTEEGIKEVSEVANEGDIDANLKSEEKDLKMKNKSSRKRVTMKSEEQQDDGTQEDSINSLKTPDRETDGAFLVKYNVSTTPYLQSVKKKMQLEETDSAVKDLKFLTPVRRSRRLQDKTCKLPAMLKDHYPCVSSLEQLAELGGETNCFIYRQNVALPGTDTEAEEPQKE
uniref:Cytoskeleton-associated protein 2 C-terminal domain-containing protein n=2 Tax=Ornithorhynchus anatinus TaxID=9258 RepID=F6X132_ORNAN